MNDRIGVVGLGRMGSGLAVSLRRVGHEVWGFDPTPVPLPELDGVVRVGTLGELGEGCAVVVLALPDAPQVRDVVDTLIPFARAGSLIVDCSTIDPAVTVELAAVARERGIRYRDAGMAGGPADAIAGKLLFMVGCPEEDWPEMEGLLGPIGREVVRCGDTGAGVTLKVVNNLLALSIFLADVEALALAGACGLDLEVTRQVLGSTGAANAALGGLVGSQLLPRHFDGAFRTALAGKDARIAAEVATREGVALRVMAATPGLLGDAVARGLGEMAAGAAGLVVEWNSGVALGEPVEEKVNDVWEER